MRLATWFRSIRRKRKRSWVGADILLHTTANWQKGKNTGEIGLERMPDGEDRIIEAGQFTPTEIIKKWTPDPILHDSSGRQQWCLMLVCNVSLRPPRTAICGRNCGGGYGGRRDRHQAIAVFADAGR